MELKELDTRHLSQIMIRVEEAKKLAYTLALARIRGPMLPMETRLLTAL
jgi:hypothetical protein